MRTSKFTIAILSLSLSGMMHGFLHSQKFSPLVESSSLAGDALPESPGSLLISREAAAEGEQKPTQPKIPDELPPVGKYRRTIPADRTAQELTAGDKLVLSLVNRTTLSANAGTLFSAGLSHLQNSRPHYGTDSGAFGQRLGAAEARGLSQSIFSYGILAAAFHDDPRYYVLGRKNKLAKRAIYSATRVVITRKDDGSSAINWPFIIGTMMASGLSNAYFPPDDRRAGRTIVSGVSSIAITAGTNQISEFSGDAMRLIFHKKRD